MKKATFFTDYSRFALNGVFRWGLVF